MENNKVQPKQNGTREEHGAWCEKMRAARGDARRRREHGQTPDLCEIVTESRPGSGIWESDTVGDNEPRSAEQCRLDIASFLAGACGPEFASGSFAVRNVVSQQVSR